MEECWVDVSAPSTTTKYVLWTWGLSSCGQDGYNDRFGGENSVCFVWVCVDKVVQGRLPTWLLKSVSWSPCPQKWCVWGGFGISKWYRSKTLFSGFTDIIIMTIKAQNHKWNGTVLLWQMLLAWQRELRNYGIQSLMESKHGSAM